MMERSPQASGPVSQSAHDNQNCKICNEKLSEGQECMILSECNHVFHDQCIETYLSHSAECPNCKRPCILSELKKINIQNKSLAFEKAKGARGKPRGAMAKHPNTRSHSKNLFSESSQNTFTEFALNNENETEISLTPGRGKSPTNMPQHVIGYRTSNTQQGIDYNQINQIIENTVSRLLANLNLVPDSTSHNRQNYHQTESPTQHPILDQNNNMRRDNRPPSNIPSAFPNPQANFNSSFEENFAVRPDRITSIIQNWNIKYDGSVQGISVDEFLYRVGVLTKEHFNNDFSLICKNLHILLTGRAREWYWRYHRQVETLSWKEFCEALKYQFKDFKSSFDIYEELRNRKMKPQESFEMFYDSVCKILDRLEKPIQESELVEILSHNLRPEIRHELLYVPVYSIAHLRKLVQMRENLLGDDYYRKNALIRNTGYTGVRKQVAEVEYTEDTTHIDMSLPLGNSVDAIQQHIKCWNCDQVGHYWEDCLEERKVFCYGCGEKNSYKPQCVKCSSKRRISKNFQALNPPPKHP